MNDTQLEKISSGRGFFAALDQSGGSTPKALADYGIAESRYSSDDEMFDLVHQMRTRVITDPAFDGSRILAAILFEQTMDREMDGVPTARYLWEQKQVVPILKVDAGLADASGSVQLMKPIERLDELIGKAQAHGIFGTKMRSVIKDADRAGINAVVDQQFEYGRRIADAGLVPILEPEVSIDSLHKDAAEAMLRDSLQTHMLAWAGRAPLMLKLTIPTDPHRYVPLSADERILRVLALSGGYDRDEACALLRRNVSMIASFSRALLDGLTNAQSDEQFNTQLDASIAQIYAASVDKVRND